MTGNQTKRAFQLAVVLLLAFALIYWQYTSLTEQQWEEIKAALSQTRWHYLFYALLIGLASHIMRALRWNLMLKTTGQSLSAFNVLMAVLLGYLANTLVPRLGEVVRCSTLVRTDKVPFEKSLGSVISERIFDTLCLLIIFFLIFFFEYRLLADYGKSLWQQFAYPNGQPAYNKLIFLAVFALIGLMLLVVLIRNLKHPKTKAIIQNLLQGLQSIFRIKAKGLFWIYTLFMWFFYVAMVYIALKSVPNTEHLGWMSAFAVMAVGSIAIIFTPGGIGAYPPIAAGILSLYQVEYSVGLAAGWVSWTMQTVTVLILGLISIILLSILNPKKKEVNYERFTTTPKT